MFSNASASFTLGEARLRWPFALAMLAVTVGALALLLSSLGKSGVRARRGVVSTGKVRATTEHSAPDAIFTLEREGVHGAVLIQAGTSWKLFGEDLSARLPRASGVYLAPFSFEQQDAVAQYRRWVSYENWPMVAQELGVARTLYQWVTPETFATLVASQGPDPGGARAKVRCAHTNDELGGRWVCQAPPPLHEPVVLVINAAWFMKSSGEVLLHQLQQANLDAPRVVVSLDEDDPFVTDAARDLARLFGAALEKGTR